MVKDSTKNKAYTAGLIAGLLTSKMIHRKNKKLRARGISGGRIKIKDIALTLAGPWGWAKMAHDAKKKNKKYKQTLKKNNIQVDDDSDDDDYGDEDYAGDAYENPAMDEEDIPLPDDFEEVVEKPKKKPKKKGKKEVGTL